MDQATKSGAKDQLIKHKSSYYHKNEVKNVLNRCFMKKHLYEDKFNYFSLIKIHLKILNVQKKAITKISLTQKNSCKLSYLMSL